MRAIMVIQIPSLCCSAHVRHIPVSLPRIDALVADMPAKYWCRNRRGAQHGRTTAARAALHKP